MRVLLIAAGFVLALAAPVFAQVYLLEADPQATTSIVPVEGTVEWLAGTDDAGRASLAGVVTIAERNVSATIEISKNSDPKLPASHLLEIAFEVPADFPGGSIAQLPGILLKQEALVQGTPLVGASARAVGNRFLFALSARPEDLDTNFMLLSNGEFMDFAVIYQTGQRAILTVHLDQTAKDTLAAMK